MTWIILGGARGVCWALANVAAARSFTCNGHVLFCVDAPSFSSTEIELALDLPLCICISSAINSVMSTTQILFNSPALHSLKRDQLVKLCKIHSIKANGKNVDLVEKLKEHAKMLPSDDPLNVAARNEISRNEGE